MPKRTSKRRPSLRKTQFVNYLRNTIIPDTKESGREGTARDLQKCARLIANNKKDAKFVRYLRTTLIPDFRASGSEGYVEDFTTCARYVTPKRR